MTIFINGKSVIIEIVDERLMVGGEEATIQIMESEKLISLKTSTQEVMLTTERFFYIINEANSRLLPDLTSIRQRLGYLEAQRLLHEQRERETKHNLMHCKSLLAIAPSQICAWRYEDGSQCQKAAYFAAFTCDPQSQGSRIILAPICSMHEDKFYELMEKDQPEALPLTYPIRKEG